MTREEIIEELNRRGYKAQPEEMVKNGVTIECIKLLTETNIHPIFRIDEVLKDAEEQHWTLDIVVEALLIEFERRKKFKIDPKKFLKKRNVLNNMYIGLQKISDEELVKKDTNFVGLEKYLYICEKRLDGGFNVVKATKQLLQHVKISEDEAWQKAEENTNDETVIASIEDLVDSETLLEQCGTTTAPFFIITNKKGHRGAASILNTKAIEELGKKLSVNEFIAIPSSIHEMLLIPCPGDPDLDVISEIVKSVNLKLVDPTERLTDRAYIMHI